MVDDLERNQQQEYKIESKKNGYIKEVIGRSITPEEERQESMEGMKKSETKGVFCRYCGEILGSIAEKRSHEMWCEKNPKGRRRNIPENEIEKEKINKTQAVLDWAKEHNQDFKIKNIPLHIHNLFNDRPSLRTRLNSLCNTGRLFRIVMGKKGYLDTAVYNYKNPNLIESTEITKKGDIWKKVCEFLDNNPNANNKDLIKQFPDDKKDTLTKYRSKWSIKRKSLINDKDAVIDLKPQEDFVPSEELKTYQEFVEYKEFKKMKKELENQ